MVPAGAVGAVGAAVPPGVGTPPLCANATPVPNVTDAIAATASVATTLRGVLRTGLSDPASTMLSAACGVSCRARAESGATNQSVAIRPWGLFPFGSPAPPDERVLRRRCRGATRFAQGDLAYRLARHDSKRAGGEPPALWNQRSLAGYWM